MTTQPTGPQPADPKIEFNPSAGLIRVVDPRIFRADRRGWCSAVAAAAAGRQGVRAVRLDLDTASCEIQFHAGPLAAAMADVLAGSLSRGRPVQRNCRRIAAFMVLAAVVATRDLESPYRLSRRRGRPALDLENTAQRAWAGGDRPRGSEWFPGRSITACRRFTGPGRGAGIVPGRPQDGDAGDPVRPATAGPGAACRDRGAGCYRQTKRPGRASTGVAAGPRLGAEHPGDRPETPALPWFGRGIVRLDLRRSDMCREFRPPPSPSSPATTWPDRRSCCMHASRGRASSGRSSRNGARATD